MNHLICILHHFTYIILHTSYIHLILHPYNLYSIIMYNTSVKKLKNTCVLCRWKPKSGSHLCLYLAQQKRNKRNLETGNDLNDHSISQLKH